MTNFILSLDGVGMSEVYRMNSVGEITHTCETPVLIAACFGFALLQCLLFASPDVL